MAYRTRVIRLNDEQFRYVTEKLATLSGASFGLANELTRSLALTDEEWKRLISAVADRLVQYGFGRQYEITADGRILESIIDLLTSPTSQ